MARLNIANPNFTYDDPEGFPHVYCYRGEKPYAQGDSPGPRLVPSSSPARSQPLTGGSACAGGGAVSRMNCSMAAAIAAASSGDAGWRTSMRGLAGLCFPLRPTGWVA